MRNFIILASIVTFIGMVHGYSNGPSEPMPEPLVVQANKMNTEEHQADLIDLCVNHWNTMPTEEYFRLCGE